MWSYWERFIWFTPLLYQGYRDWHSHRARAKRGQAGPSGGQVSRRSFIAVARSDRSALAADVAASKSPEAP